MNKIYSIKTRKPLGKQDTKANDKLADTKGRYIGCLPKDDADTLRKFQEALICQQAVINELIQEFDEGYKSYLQDVASTLLYLNIDPQSFNPTKERLFIGEDGHMWVVSNED